MSDTKKRPDVFPIADDELHQAWLRVYAALDLKDHPPEIKKTLWVAFHLGADTLLSLLFTMTPQLMMSPEPVQVAMKDVQIKALKLELRRFWEAVGVQMSQEPKLAGRTKPHAN